MDAVRRALASRTVGNTIVYFDRVASSMDEARRLSDRGASDGTVVIAEEQTAGRGRFNRAWTSPRGENLSFSIALRPSASQLPFVNMAATLAVSSAVDGFTGTHSAIKWPNDVRVRGRKISGILVETVVESGETRLGVVGIGINVNLDPSRFPEIAPIATSIFWETGRKADRTEVLLEVLMRFDDLYRLVRQGESLVERWAAKLETLGRDVTVRWGERVYEGRAQSVDEVGNLVLSQPGGSRITLVAGEVTSQV